MDKKLFVFLKQLFNELNEEIMPSLQFLSHT